MKYISIFLLSSLLFITGGVFTYAQDAGELETRLEQLQKKRQKLESQSQELKNQLHNTRQKADTLENRVQNLKLQIRNLQVKINTTENKIQASKIKIESLKEEIARISGSIEENSSNLENMVRALYISSNKSPLELFLSSQTFAEYFQDQNYIGTLENRLNQLLRQLKKRQSDLQEARTQRQKQLQELQSLEQDLEAQQYAIRKQRQTQKDLLQETRGQEARYQQRLSRVEQKKSEILSDISQLENRIAEQKSYLRVSEATSIPQADTKLLSNPLPDSVITQHYGMTKFAKRGIYGGAPHNGIDLAAGAGTPIKAAADGTVFAKGSNEAWGNWVALKHLGGVVSLYAHMSQAAPVQVEQNVTTKTTIGYEGSSGFSTGSHLHFSLYKKFFTFKKNGDIWFNYFEGTLNPMDYM